MNNSIMEIGHFLCCQVFLQNITTNSILNTLRKHVAKNFQNIIISPPFSIGKTKQKALEGILQGLSNYINTNFLYIFKPFHTLDILVFKFIEYRQIYFRIDRYFHALLLNLSFKDELHCNRCRQPDRA